MGQVDCHPGVGGLQARNNQVLGNLDRTILVAGIRLGGCGLTNGHSCQAPVIAEGLRQSTAITGAWLDGYEPRTDALPRMGTKKGPGAFGS